MSLLLIYMYDYYFRKEAMVVIDGAQKTQVPEPTGPVRPFKLTSPLYVGATKVDRIDR